MFSFDAVEGALGRELGDLNLITCVISHLFSVYFSFFICKIRKE